mgnify:CR=1 FL=1
MSARPDPDTPRPRAYDPADPHPILDRVMLGILAAALAGTIVIHALS